MSFRLFRVVYKGLKQPYSLSPAGAGRDLPEPMGYILTAILGAAGRMLDQTTRPLAKRGRNFLKRILGVYLLVRLNF